jgi:septal ring factor EnvC (AmiA/AmiB activator)
MGKLTEVVIESTFKGDDLAAKYTAYVAKVKAASAELKPPAIDMAKLAKLVAAGSGKKAANFSASFDEKVVTLTIEYGTTVLARSVQKVLDEPNVNKRRNLTAGLVKLKLMTQDAAGKMDRVTLTPQRRAIDAAQTELEALLKKIRETEENLKTLKSERTKKLADLKRLVEATP